MQLKLHHPYGISGNVYEEPIGYNRVIPDKTLAEWEPHLTQHWEVRYTER